MDKIDKSSGRRIPVDAGIVISFKKDNEFRWIRM